MQDRLVARGLLEVEQRPAAASPRRPRPRRRPRPAPASPRSRRRPRRQRTGSRSFVSGQCVGILMSSVIGHTIGSPAGNASSRSAAVRTAITPGIDAAAVVSIESIDACTYGGTDELHPHHARDDVVVDERPLAGDERRVFLAQDRRADVRLGGCHHALLTPSSMRRPRRGPSGRCSRTRAAAEVALEALAHVVLRRRRAALPMLAAAMIMPGVQYPHCSPWLRWKASWSGCSVSVGRGHRLDRRDLPTVDLRREEGARLHGLPVQMHRARTTGRGVASDVRPR